MDDLLNNTENTLNFLTIPTYINTELIDKKDEDVILYINSEEFKNNIIDLCCMYKIYFTKSTILYLYNISKFCSTQNTNGSFTEKEIAGSFILKNNGKNNPYSANINKNSIIIGSEEGVGIVKHKYSFHTHPTEAYKKYKVKYGWPSYHDYIGFLVSSLKYNTEFHAVITIEGIYIISNGDNKINKGNIKDIKKFIEKNYDVLGTNNKSINWYINKINNTKYHNKSLVIIQFLSWSNSSTTFSINKKK